MSDKYCAPMIHNGKQISGGAARNIRIRKAGGLEKIIDFTSKAASLLTTQKILGVTNDNLKTVKTTK